MTACVCMHLSVCSCVLCWQDVEKINWHCVSHKRSPSHKRSLNNYKDYNKLTQFDVVIDYYILFKYNCILTTFSGKNKYIGLVIFCVWFNKACNMSPSTPGTSIKWKNEEEKKCLLVLMHVDTLYTVKTAACEPLDPNFLIKHLHRYKPSCPW